jgi:hypothetical protein
MWRTWKSGDKGKVAIRLDVDSSQVSLLPGGWIILRDYPYPGSWRLQRLGYSSEDGWQFTDYGDYAGRLSARRAMDPEYRDSLRNAEFKLYELGIPEGKIDEILEDF